MGKHIEEIKTISCLEARTNGYDLVTRTEDCLKVVFWGKDYQ